jgi:SAM-dependent methyltransferase
MCPGESPGQSVCTQVLNYTANPFQVIAEIHRVLRPGGSLFLSVPAIFPRYANQRWRFMPEGLIVLLAPFSFYEIVPEGYSIAGILRLFNLFLDTVILDAIIPWTRARRSISSVAFTVTNLAGLAMDRASAAWSIYGCPLQGVNEEGRQGFAR